MSDSARCPNCGKDVVVPKSTKSFICRLCDALLKATSTEKGYELKLLGKSIDDNEEFQAIADAVARLRIEILDMHAKYEFEAIRSTGKAPGRLRAALAVLLMLVAGVLTVMGNSVAGWVALGGIATFVVAVVMKRANDKARQERLAALGEELEAMARQRDALEARGARIKVTSV